MNIGLYITLLLPVRSFVLELILLSVFVSIKMYMLEILMGERVAASNLMVDYVSKRLRTTGLSYFTVSSIFLLHVCGQTNTDKTWKGEVIPQECVWRSSMLISDGGTNFIETVWGK